MNTVAYTCTSILTLLWLTFGPLRYIDWNTRSCRVRHTFAANKDRRRERSGWLTQGTKTIWKEIYLLHAESEINLTDFNIDFCSACQFNFLITLSADKSGDRWWEFSLNVFSSIDRRAHRGAIDAVSSLTFYVFIWWLKRRMSPRTVVVIMSTLACCCSSLVTAVGPVGKKQTKMFNSSLANQV